MTNSLKSELRKLLTVRSTYFIFIIALAIVILVAGYGNGYKIDSGSLHNTNFFVLMSTNAVLFVGVLLAIVGLLLLGHEYRYNTVLYTITSSKSRVQSLLAKLIVISIFALFSAAVVTFFSPLCALIGIHLVNKHLVAQNFPVWSVLWKCLFVGWGYAMYAFIITAIIRSQVGSIVTYLLVPLIGEHIIESIIKSSPKYLPFNSLQSVFNTNLPRTTDVSTAHNVTVACIYIAAGLVVSFVLFARRDAN